MIPMLADEYYVALATVLAAMIPVFLGIRQYAKGQVTQRQQVLFGLIDELNKSPALEPAKRLLGYDYVETPKPLNKTRNPEGPACCYFVETLSFLRNYKKDSSDKKDSRDSPVRIDDAGELQVKESLDSFIVFLGKVGYSLSIGALSLNEITYFQYYIGKTRTNVIVKDYIRNNEFPLYMVLLKELKKELENPGILTQFSWQLQKSYRYLKVMRTVAAKQEWFMDLELAPRHEKP